MNLFSMSCSQRLGSKLKRLGLLCLLLLEISRLIIRSSIVWGVSSSMSTPRLAARFEWVTISFVGLEKQHEYADYCFQIHQGPENHDILKLLNFREIYSWVLLRDQHFSFKETGVSTNLWFLLSEKTQRYYCRSSNAILSLGLGVISGWLWAKELMRRFNWMVLY